MKHIITIINIIFLTGFLNIFAQNPNYVKAMEGLVTEIQNAKFGTFKQALTNKMERIAATEKTEWLPNYWVAYCYLMDSYVEKGNDKRDLLLDKADKFLANVDKLVKNNDEVEILRANIANARIAISPSFRWMTYGGKVEDALDKAKKIKANNPRIALLEGQGVFYKPAMFGGGKGKAKPILEKAIEQFSKFKPASTIHPNWGEGTVKWMLSQI